MMKNNSTRAGLCVCPISLIRLLAIIMTIVISACSNHTSYHTYMPVDASGWNNCDTLHFDTGRADDGREDQFRIGIRHKDTYPYRDIWLTIGSDTVHLYLADEEGSWLGNGIGDQRLFTSPVTIRLTNDTLGRISITHIMQHNPLPGINNIGLEIMDAK